MSVERWVYIVRLRLRSLFRRSRVEDDLSDELHDHLEHRISEFIERGMTPSDARNAALRAFGGVEQRKEECRDARGVGYVEDLVKDLGYAVRMMRRGPAFTAAAILSLALGIGANTAIFTIFDAMLLKPLAVDRPEDLRTTNTLSGGGTKQTPFVPLSLFEEIGRDGSIFSDVLAFTTHRDVIVQADTGTLTSGPSVFVSTNYFTMLGVRAELGRVFDPIADPSSSSGTVVIADRLWRREFASDRSVLGRSIVVNGATFTVIGVAPRGFSGLTVGEMSDLFLPLAALPLVSPSSRLTDRSDWQVRLVGRLRPGVDEEVAGGRLTTLRRVHDASRPNRPPSPVVSIHPIETGLSNVRQRFMQPLAVLMGMVVVLLVIGCANVATMLLSRASARRAEIVIRAAIGAGQGRLRRQMLTESAVLVVMAAAIGVVFARWATQALVALLQYSDTPLAIDVGLDRRVLLFTIAISAGAATMAGLTPALHAARMHAGLVLRDRRDGMRSTAGSRLERLFVVGQIALSLTLVTAAGLLARTVYTLSTTDPGFHSDRVVLAEVNPGEHGYDTQASGRYFQELLTRLRGAPSVESVTLTQFSFLSSSRTTGSFDVPGFVPATEDDRMVQVYQVGPQFFKTMGMRVVEGRDFEDRDMSASPLPTVLNETAARQFFGTTNLSHVTDGNRQIIGVVRDSRYNTLRENGVAAIFVPYPSGRRGRMTFAVRVNSERAGAQTVLSRIRELDPAIPVQITTLDTLVTRSVGQERLLAAIATFFGATAVLLLTIGLYGVMAFWVSERTPEIGVRLALGAHPRQVVWTVLQRPLRFVMIGSSIGLLITWVGSQLIASLLFGLSPQDPSTIAGGVLVMVIVAVIAAYVPARRAAGIDPVAALRAE